MSFVHPQVFKVIGGKPKSDTTLYFL